MLHLSCILKVKVQALDAYNAIYFTIVLPFGEIEMALNEADNLELWNEIETKNQICVKVDMKLSFKWK